MMMKIQSINNIN